MFVGNVYLCCICCRRREFVVLISITSKQPANSRGPDSDIWYYLNGIHNVLVIGTSFAQYIT